MEERSGVSHVLRGILCRSRECLAISVYSLREWRRCFSHPLHSGTLHHRQTLLLHGDDSRTIHQQLLRSNLVRVAFIPRYRSPPSPHIKTKV